MPRLLLLSVSLVHCSHWLHWGQSLRLRPNCD